MLHERYPKRLALSYVNSTILFGHLSYKNITCSTIITVRKYFEGTTEVHQELFIVRINSIITLIFSFATSNMVVMGIICHLVSS